MKEGLEKNNLNLRSSLIQHAERAEQSAKKMREFLNSCSSDEIATLESWILAVHEVSPGQEESKGERSAPGNGGEDSQLRPGAAYVAPPKPDPHPIRGALDAALKKACRDLDARGRGITLNSAYKELVRTGYPFARGGDYSKSYVGVRLAKIAKTEKSWLRLKVPKRGMRPAMYAFVVSFPALTTDPSEPADHGQHDKQPEDGHD